MARYTGSVCRICRREGEKLYLKGDRCYTEKCAVGKRAYPPGQHGQGRKKASEYGIQLREKQKLRRMYGLLERQFHNYFEEAERGHGVTGELLLQLLEVRLDNVIYRLGLSSSRNEGRQMARHGFFTVNGKKVNIPSYQLKAGDVIQIAENKSDSPRVKALVENAAGKAVPEWLELDLNTMTAKVINLPAREQIDVPVKEHLIVELYSR
ncbi:MAG TPA: 30S ribosomal protein S4 [Firmicutes bacterium]|jgi:small subunit ribosomal protein S4|nr:30S ribosomal protein S4 [Bacillota bacterium]HBE05471.1 30S ribosomal protein S4 [Bacillota bacterium]HBG45136.1 30S ribosomal protein S4 [Bacillota bacterium]HBR24569.1 30S ribosomal protein S4 [Bacillota bacterium]HCF93038.1 30S ribosomal protein S4 [Bacillota bacterium]